MTRSSASQPSRPRLEASYQAVQNLHLLILAPLINKRTFPQAFLSCWVVPLDGLPFQPWYGWYLVGMFRASLVISRWSYPLGWSTKGGFPSFPFSALVVALQSPKAPFKLHMSIGGNVGRKTKLEPLPRVAVPPSAGIGCLPCRWWVEGLNGGRGSVLLTLVVFF